MGGTKGLRPATARMHDALSRRALRTLALPFCLICLTAIAGVLLTSRTAGPDLFDLVPRVSRLGGYVLVAWYDLERAHQSLKTGGLFAGTPTRALGYMMEGDEPIHDGQLVSHFVLLPDAGSVLHPAHRFGDQMIAVHLPQGAPVRFSEASLVWAWGTLRTLAGDPAGDRPLYVLEEAQIEPARKADIPKYFR